MDNASEISGYLDSSNMPVNLTEHFEEESQFLPQKSFASLEELDSTFEEDSSSTNASEAARLQTTLYRWPVLLVLGANITLNSLIYMGLAPVAPVVRDAYQLGSDFLPNFCQMLFPLFSLLMTPVAIYAYREQRVANVLRVSALVFLLGAWLRSGIVRNGDFNFIAAGSALIASSSPFFVIAQSIVAKKWFPDT